MSGNLSEVVKKGDIIQVFGSDGALRANKYLVVNKVRSVIVLEDCETKKPDRVHKSRVAKILNVEEDASMEKDVKAQGKAPETPVVPAPAPAPAPVAAADAPAAPAEAKPAKAVKPAKVAKPVKVEKVDFKQMLADGFEVWTKSTEFNDKEGKPVDGIKVESHCAIAQDGLSYRVFNTYNGGLGKKDAAKKKNPEGMSYKLADAAALEKKREDLKKKGYKPRKK